MCLLGPSRRIRGRSWPTTAGTGGPPPATTTDPFEPCGATRSTSAPAHQSSAAPELLRRRLGLEAALWLVHDVREAVEAAAEVSGLDRDLIRSDAQHRFSLDRMVDA